jgi:hypothetical protein
LAQNLGGYRKDVDFSSISPESKRIHDLAALTDLSGGEYKLINPSLDLSVSVSFPADLYEYVRYWGTFGVLKPHLSLAVITISALSLARRSRTSD